MDAKDIAVEAVQLLKLDIQATLDARKKVATGNTRDRLVVLPSGGAGSGFGQAALEADSHWKYVGNGRPPGGMPPLQSIRNWIQAKGLSLNEYAVARKIAKEGSKDFRFKNKNVFLDRIRAWEKNEMVKAEDQLAKLMEQRVTDIIDQVKFN